VLEYQARQDLLEAMQAIRNGAKVPAVMTYVLKADGRAAMLQHYADKYPTYAALLRAADTSATTVARQMNTLAATQHTTDGPKPRTGA